MLSMSAGDALRIQAEKYFQPSYRQYLLDIKNSSGEKQLSEKQALYLGLAGIMWTTADRMVDYPKTAFAEIAKCAAAFCTLGFVSKDDYVGIVTAFDKMLSYRIIRMDSSLCTWITEMAWWAAFDEENQEPPPAISAFFERVLQGRATLLNLKVISDFD